MTLRRACRTSQLSLFDGAAPALRPTLPIAGIPRPPSSQPIRIADAREFAVDPRHNVVLEASAGTGKTSVLVWRYVNLLKAGVEPGNILAITFTRKAAAEMRERIIRELRRAAARSEFDRARWNDIRDRLGDIAISTIDAFCLSLLREFPLEADLDPGFEMADETEVPRLVEESLDRSLRIFAGLARRRTPDVALVLAQLGVSRTREGLASLLERRLVAWECARPVSCARAGGSDRRDRLPPRRDGAAGRACARCRAGWPAFLADGPVDHPRYPAAARAISRRLADLERCGRCADPRHARSRRARISDRRRQAADGAARIHALQERARLPVGRGGEASPRRRVPDRAARRARHAALHAAISTSCSRAASGRMFAIALAQYRKALDERSVLDFSDVLQRALDLLGRWTSSRRAGTGSSRATTTCSSTSSRTRAARNGSSCRCWSSRGAKGSASRPSPSIFIVGDRKQSIYRFRDAEVAVLQEAGALHRRAAPGRQSAPLDQPQLPRGARAAGIRQRAVRRDVAARGAARRLHLRRGRSVSGRSRQRSPRGAGARAGGRRTNADACAAAVADEIARILREETVRDRKTGVAAAGAARRHRHPVPLAHEPSRVRARARGRAGFPTYVYKGLGFFDADEIKDVSALHALPGGSASDLRAAAFLRSRFVRLSDGALARLGAEARRGADRSRAVPTPSTALDDEDRRVLAARSRARAAAGLRRSIACRRRI